jgi:hypothetical protein
MKTKEDVSESKIKMMNELQKKKKEKKKEEIKLKKMLKNLTSDLCPDSLLTKSP